MKIEDTIWLLAHSTNPEDRREWAVLYWKSQGLKHEEIAEKWDYSIQWVQRYMTRAYKRFDVPPQLNKYEKLQYLEENVFPLMRKFIANEPETVRELPAPPEQEIQVSDEKNSDLVEDEKPTEPSIPIIKIDFPKKLPPPKDDGDGCRRLFFAVVGLVILCIVGSFAYYLGRGSTSPTQPVVITATFPPAANPSDTALPLASAVFTPTITLTPTPTFTALPSYTPKPTISLPFADNFSNGVSSPWAIVSGKWIVDSTGATITIMDGDSQTGAIVLDDLSMTNYRLRVKVHSPNVLSANQGGLAVVVRYRSDHDENLAFYMNSASRFAWGYLSTLSNLDFNLPRITSVTNANIISDFILEIEVQGNNFVARVDGEKYDSFTMSGYETGGIALVTLCGNVGSCPSFSNFSLEPLP